MVQARGIQIRENVKNIGAQVLEQVVRGAYNINGTGENIHIDRLRCIALYGCLYIDVLCNYVKLQGVHFSPQVNYR